MQGIEFIEDLAAVMIAAGLLGALCKRIGLSVIVGYLAAGIVLGPYTPPFAFVHNLERIHTLSQLGLVFLMFSIGLELSLNKLRGLGPGMAIAAGLGAFFVFNLTQALGTVAGWSKPQTMFTAAMLMVSSSAVIAKMLRDLRLEHERAGQQALGIAVLEDVVAIVMLTLLGSYTKIGGAAKTTGVSVVIAGLSGFVVLTVMAALLFIPRLLKRLQAKADPELQTIIVAGVLFSLALAAVWAGYSMALGAFLLGAVVAELPQRNNVEHAFAGVRDIFSSVFFVSIGMLIDVRLFGQVWPWVLGLGVFVLIARPLSVGMALILTGTPPRDARKAGLCMSPLGEFSFVIAQMGVEAGVLPKTHYTLAVGVSLVTVICAPLINRRAEPLLGWIETHEPRGVRRLLEIYHRWLAQMVAAPDSREWWRRGRPHLIHIAIEVLLVTGMLLSAEAFYGVLEKSRVASTLDHLHFRMLFWGILGLATVVPLVGIGWSVRALSQIVAESLQGRSRFSIGAARTIIQTSAAALGVVWLGLLIPSQQLSSRGLWVIIGVLAILVALFSRRLVSLRASLFGSVGQVLEGSSAPSLPARWEQPSADWELNLEELELPSMTPCAGQSIASLRIRSRFGCTIVEINRQGYLLAGPEPKVQLFPGDRLLVLGTAEQIAAMRSEFIRENSGPDEAAGFDDSLLDTVTVPENPEMTGRPLRELRIPHRTGVVVVGIRRGDQQQVNPTGDEIVHAGDQWLVVGSTDELRRLRSLLVGEAAPSLVLENAG
ncbi:MAG TPA: cation:proton antiporter [Verrucomicrobiae bacterium]|nr:cation:proton antiporter [Verrucomicrobiae bacterium]